MVDIRDLPSEAGFKVLYTFWFRALVSSSAYAKSRDLEPRERNQYIYLTYGIFLRVRELGYAKEYTILSQLNGEDFKELLLCDVCI